MDEKGEIVEDFNPTNIQIFKEIILDLTDNSTLIIIGAIVIAAFNKEIQSEILTGLLVHVGGEVQRKRDST